MASNTDKYAHLRPTNPIVMTDTEYENLPMAAPSRTKYANLPIAPPTRAEYAEYAEYADYASLPMAPPSHSTQSKFAGLKRPTNPITFDDDINYGLGARAEELYAVPSRDAFENPSYAYPARAEHQDVGAFTNPGYAYPARAEPVYDVPRLKRDATFVIPKQHQDVGAFTNPGYAYPARAEPEYGALPRRDEAIFANSAHAAPRRDDEDDGDDHIYEGLPPLYRSKDGNPPPYRFAGDGNPPSYHLAGDDKDGKDGKDHGYRLREELQEIDEMERENQVLRDRVNVLKERKRQDDEMTRN